MKKQISSLMDGEMCNEEAETLLTRIRNHSEAREEWATYHLIGDILRQPDYVAKDCASTIAQRLRDEPTILAPHTRAQSRLSGFAMAAVASVMAMAFLAWMTMHIDAGQTGLGKVQVAVQPANENSASVAQGNDAVNDYLLAHHEYSPNSEVRGASSYIRTVSIRQAAAGHE